MKETEENAISKARDLRKWFPVRTGIVSTLFSRRLKYVKAVDGISFDINKGEIFGLVGESGSGKTTTGRLLLRSIEPTGGKLYFENQDIIAMKKKDLKKLRKEMQMIFQDPYESLNPRMKVYDIIAEPLRIHKILESKTEEEKKVEKALKSTRLAPPEKYMQQYPHQLSGGERQRVAIARALVLEPKFIVADEPVSMLDVSLRSDILNLILDLRDTYGFTCLYITHDFSVSRYICDRIMVMYLGKTMEIGPAEEVINNPQHPYTKALISVIPVPDPTAKRSRTVITSEIPSPIEPPPGCRFHTRCPYAMDKCHRKEPQLVEVDSRHFVACYLISDSEKNR